MLNKHGAAALSVLCGLLLVVAAPRAVAVSSEVSFKPAQLYKTGSNPSSVGVGDVNGDGRNDVVMTTRSYYDPPHDNKLFVFTQQPNGALKRTQMLPYHADEHVNAAFAGLDVGDVDGDGKQDVVVAGDLGIDIFLQKGGRLSTPILVRMGDSAAWVRIADVDHDGRKDIVVVRDVSGGSDPLLYWVRNTPHGFVSHEITPVLNAHAIDVADMDGDGKTDIVAMQEDNPPDLTVLRYRPDETFAEQRLTAEPGGADNIALGRMTASMLPEIAIAYTGPTTPSGTLQSTIDVLARNSERKYSQVFHAAPATGRSTGTIRVVDIDQDGRADLVLNEPSTPQAGRIAWFRNLGGNRFAAESTWPNPYGGQAWPDGMAVGDVNSDGKPDVVLAGGLEDDGLVVIRQR